MRETLRARVKTPVCIGFYLLLVFRGVNNYDNNNVSNNTITKFEAKKDTSFVRALFITEAIFPHFSQKISGNRFKVKIK